MSFHGSSEVANVTLQGRIGRRRVKVLVDTGAQVSILFLPRGDKKPLEPPRCRIRGLGDTVVWPLGACHVNLRVGREEYPFKMEVLPKRRRELDVILGNDFLRQFQGIVDYRSQTVQFGDVVHRFGSGHIVQTRGGPEKGAFSRDPVEPRTAVLKATTPVTINGGTGRVLWVAFESRNLSPTALLVDPLARNEALDKMQVHVKRSLCNAESEGGKFRIPVSIDNFGTKEVVIPRGTVLASVQCVEAEEVPVDRSRESPGKEARVFSVEELHAVTPQLEERLKGKLAHLDEASQETLYSVLKEYAWLFESRKCLPATDLVYHEIPTGNARPIAQKAYRIPHHLQPVVDEIIQEQLDAGIIQPSASPWASPIVLVPKKSLNGEKSYRMCVDLRAVNKVTTPDTYPLPRIDETLDRLGNCRYFTTLDMRSGYHQIKIAPQDAPKTAFIVPSGLYEFVRMPFGLRNAPATFQRFADLLLRGLKPMTCLVYLDDIIIFSRTIEEHAERLRNVLARLRGANLSLKLEKCFFAESQVQYLGHIISSDGVKPDPRLIEAVRTFPVPANIKELQSFLGLSNFYRRHVQDYAAITKPLTHLLKKGVTFDWTPECDRAMQRVKDILTSSPLLAYPDFEKPFILSCDASDFAVGCVLSQEQNGEEKPIGYASRQLNKAERNYGTTEKELLAVVFGVNYFRCYLYGRPFTVVTDHAALQWMLSLKDPSSRLTRWALRLSEFDYTVKHKPGKLHQNADALSRKVRIVQVEDVLVDELKKEQEVDVECQEYVKRPGFELVDGVLYKKTPLGNRIVVPKALQPQILAQCHDSLQACHNGKKATNYRIATRYWWRRRQQDVDKYVRDCLPCAQRTQNKRLRIPMQTLPETSRPWQLTALDLVGPLPQTPRGNKYVLSIIDHFSRFLILVPLADMSAETVAQAFVNRVVLPYGSPEALLTDRGTSFMGSLFVQVCKLLRIRKWRTSPFHPQANGRVERVHKTIAKMLAHYVNSTHTNWDKYLAFVASAYNSRVHESTGLTPYEVIYGRTMNSPFELDKLPPGVDVQEVKSLAHRLKDIWRKVQKSNRKATDRQLRRGNEGATLPPYKIGDWVLVRNTMVKPGRTKKFTPLFEGPYRITRLTSPVNAEVQLTDRTVVVHFDRLKPYHGQVTPRPVVSEPAAPRKPGRPRKIKPTEPIAPPTRRKYPPRSRHPYGLRSRDLQS